MTTCEILRIRSIKVRLTADLTSYHVDLREGAEGTTQFDNAVWGIWCYFPGAGRWDILSKSIEIIDKEYLDALAKEQAQERIKIQSDRMLFTSNRKTHLLVDIIYNDNDWDTHIMACGRTAKTGSMFSPSSPFAPALNWCQICYEKYKLLPPMSNQHENKKAHRSD